MDHIQHNKDQQQATRQARCCAALLGELGDKQGDGPEDAADQHEIQAEEQGIAQAKVRAGALAACKGQQRDEQAHHEQGRPHRCQLLQRDPPAPTRQREQGIQRAALLFAAQQATARQ